MNGIPSLLLILLSFIPGLGHLYLKRYVRAIFYAGGFFGPLCLLFVSFIFGSVAYHMSQTIAFLLLLCAAFFWFINLIDMVITIGARSVTRPYTPPGTSPEGHPYEGNWHQIDDEKNKIVALSIIPGLGHFHLGLMYRGLTAMVLFFGSAGSMLFLAIITSREGFLAFLVVLPVIWFYVLFDALHQYKRKLAGEELIDRTFMDDFHDNHYTGKKNRTIATILAVFPGAGHMYLGLQKRGFQLMVAFLLTLYTLDVMRLSLFLFLVPILWFFSFFDALQNISKMEYEVLQDRPVFGNWQRYNKIIGLFLIFVALYNIVMGPLFYVLMNEFFPESSNWHYHLQTYMQTLTVTFVLIVIGLVFLFKSKKNVPNEDEDVPPEDLGSNYPPTDSYDEVKPSSTYSIDHIPFFQENDLPLKDFKEDLEKKKQTDQKQATDELPNKNSDLS